MDTSSDTAINPYNSSWLEQRWNCDAALPDGLAPADPTEAPSDSVAAIVR
jgi:hypothetical protein